jgi:hypothetical protein
VKVKPTNIAFAEWRLLRQQNDRLPRGPYFKGKAPGIRNAFDMARREKLKRGDFMKILDFPFPEGPPSNRNPFEKSQ